jgi:hypothetical protein
MIQTLQELTKNTSIQSLHPIYIIQNMIILIRTGEREETAKRGAYFLPTIGIATLDILTAGHPRARLG